MLIMDIKYYVCALGNTSIKLSLGKNVGTRGLIENDIRVFLSHLLSQSF